MCTAIRLAFWSTATPRFLVHHSDGFFSALAQGDAGRLSQRSDEPRPHVAPSRMAEPRRRAPCAGRWRCRSATNSASGSPWPTGAILSRTSAPGSRRPDLRRKPPERNGCPGETQEIFSRRCRASFRPTVSGPALRSLLLSRTYARPSSGGRAGSTLLSGGRRNTILFPLASSRRGFDGVVRDSRATFEAGKNRRPIKIDGRPIDETAWPGWPSLPS